MEATLMAEAGRVYGFGLLRPEIAGEEKVMPEVPVELKDCEGSDREEGCWRTLKTKVLFAARRAH